MPVDVRHTAAVIVAAGNGVRMGKGVSKVLLPLGGETILERAVNAFLAAPLIDEVVIVCRSEDRPLMEHLPYRNPRGISLLFVQGGKVRQESVCNGLQFLAARGNGNGSRYVAVHDAARCFIRPEVITRAVETAYAHDAVTVAVPLVDSIKRVAENGQVECSISRDQIWCVQTPQVFRFELLYEAHQRALEVTHTCAASDDASLVEALRPVFVSEGERGNFKITTPEDYEIARTLAAAG